MLLSVLSFVGAHFEPSRSNETESSSCVHVCVKETKGERERENNGERKNMCVSLCV